MTWGTVDEQTLVLALGGAWWFAPACGVRFSLERLGVTWWSLGFLGSLLSRRLFQDGGVMVVDDIDLRFYAFLATQSSLSGPWLL